MDRRTADLARLALVALLAFAAGWGLRGAVMLERVPPGAPADPATVALPDTALISPETVGDTARVTPDEAAVARPRTVPAPSTAPSGLVLPVAGIRPADLVDTYAAARGEGRSHDAIDILAPRGTPVLAAAAGSVLRLFTSERGGLTVYVLAEDGETVHYYAHLDAYAPGLAAGQRVGRGRPLGTVGDSGNATPGNTHLHYAIWRISDPHDFWDGEPVNPYPLLGGR
jgi:murein DD-endopeptidase MepM/ murein hydrolase activator NlpD